MKRLVLFFLLAASGTAHAASWSDLWVTHDDRRQAYDEIQAGKYASAAKRLERFKDPQSQYNRGNAFARGGKLENALAAYDSAIKQTQADSELGRDARHNRDLVEQQLKKQQSQQQPQQQGQQSQQSQPGQQGQQAQQNRQGQKSQEPQSQQDAKRDAEAAMAQVKQDEKARANQQPQQAKPGGQSKGEKSDQNDKPAAAAVDQPPSEQALALDQWLRQIPDDPSGLLRRKFWIEHLRREQEWRQ